MNITQRNLELVRKRRKTMNFWEEWQGSQKTTDLKDTSTWASETISQQEHENVQQTAEQVGKWDDLAHDHKKHASLRISCNDIVRHLIDQATLDSLEGIKRHV